jgi:hypothetical protein
MRFTDLMPVSAIVAYLKRLKPGMTFVGAPLTLRSAIRWYGVAGAWVIAPATMQAFV